MEGPLLYPVALDLCEKRCVVVGAGAVGTRRAEALRAAGADVVVVSRETSGPFEPSHLDGAFLVVVATDDPEVNDAVVRAARERGVLVNLAAPGDESEGGDFVTMAAVRRGGLLLAVTTGGAGPALSARLKRELQEQFGPEWALWVALLARLRQEAKERIPDPQERAERLRGLAGRDDLLEKLRVGEIDSALQEAASCLS